MFIQLYILYVVTCTDIHLVLLQYACVPWLRPTRTKQCM